jgi:hypothetical protein
VLEKLSGKELDLDDLDINKGGKIEQNDSDYILNSYLDFPTEVSIDLEDGFYRYGSIKFP